MLVAVLLVAIVGSQALLLDVLRVYGARWSLQTAVDAAAAAGGAYLPAPDGSLGEATTAALEYAVLNGASLENVDVYFSTDSMTNDRVTVSVVESVPLTLGRIFGISTTSVRVVATAQSGSLGSRSGLLPWGVVPSDADLRFGELSCLKLATDETTCAGIRGSFNALDIDDVGSNSASVYRDRIVTGSTVRRAVGDIVRQLSGNMRGPTEQGVGCTGSGGRISGNNSTFEETVIATESGQQVIDWTNTRIAVLPFVEQSEPDAVVIIGFGAFFIEGCGNGGAVVGRFIQTIVPGGGWHPLQQDFGARSVRLTE